MQSELQDQEPSIRVGIVLQEYRKITGRQPDTQEPIAFEELGRDLLYEDVQNNVDLFANYLPFISSHFDKEHPLNLSHILRILDRPGGKEKLERLLPIFKMNSELVKLYYKESAVDPEEIKGSRNTSDFRRLLYGEKISPEELAGLVEKILSDNKELYDRLDQKYKSIDTNELVVCTMFEDSIPAEICLVFLNRNLKPYNQDNIAIKQESIDNIRTCRVLIRPRSGGIDFLTRHVDLSKSGLVKDDNHQGYLFLAPPHSRIDEKALLELLASDKTSEEIKEALEDGVGGVKDFLYAQP